MCINSIVYYTLRHLSVMGSKEINCQKLPLLSPLWTGVILADFHNVGITPDLNDELNTWAKGVDSSFAQALKNSDRWINHAKSFTCVKFAQNFIYFRRDKFGLTALETINWHLKKI